MKMYGGAEVQFHHSSPWHHMEVFQSTVPLKLYITDYIFYGMKTSWFSFVLKNTRIKNYSTHMDDFYCYKRS
jgi:hypothetical protein